MNKLKIPGILLLLSVLLSACQTGGPQLVADSQKSEYHLACKLAGESELKVSSPDLNKQFFLQSQQTDLSLPLVETSEDEDVTPPRDLEVSYANPNAGGWTVPPLIWSSCPANGCCRSTRALPPMMKLMAAGCCRSTSART